MLKITELQGRGNKNLDRESNLRRNYLKWIKSHWNLWIIGSIFLLFFAHPLEINSKVIRESGKTEFRKIIPREDIISLDYRLHTEVENYIKDNSFGSKLKASKLIEECYVQEFDLVLALSQGHIESHFGTRGAAAYTGSVFNVGTFDDGTILYRYKDPNLSVAPYVRLVKNRYMAGVKTTSDLLQPKGFIHYYRKQRYASEKRYEYLVKGVYDKILNQTAIDSLWKAQFNEDVIYSRSYWESWDCLQKLLESTI